MHKACGIWWINYSLLSPGGCEEFIMEKLGCIQTCLPTCHCKMRHMSEGFGTFWITWKLSREAGPLKFAGQLGVWHIVTKQDKTAIKLTRTVSAREQANSTGARLWLGLGPGALFEDCSCVHWTSVEKPALPRSREIFFHPLWLSAGGRKEKWEQPPPLALHLGVTCPTPKWVTFHEARGWAVSALEVFN